MFLNELLYCMILRYYLYNTYNMKTGDNLQEFYDKQYGESIDGWREICSTHKASRLTSLINGEKDLKVVDWGAGQGSILEILNKVDEISELHALEISDSGIEKLKARKLKKLKGITKFDGYNTDFADNEFDIAICFHVIEHVEFPRLLLKEIKRISKRQIFEIPLDYTPNVDRHAEHYFAYGHINVYSPATFRFLLAAEGLVVEKEVFEGIPLEIRRFQEYAIKGKNKTIFTELKLIFKNVRIGLSRALVGKRIGRELFYESYTCLTSKSSVDSVKIGGE